MGSAEQMWSGAKWQVPGWERPAVSSDLGRWSASASAKPVDSAPVVPADEPGELLSASATIEGLDRLLAAGVTRLRVPLDWARLEPTNSRPDPVAAEHLVQAIGLARSRGLAIWACLHDLDLPGWFAHDERGFSDERTRGYHWSRYVETVGELVGDMVQGWIPVMEPTRWAKRGWLDGTTAPGSVGDTGGFMRNLQGIHAASVQAALRLRESGSPVASAQWSVPVFPARTAPNLPIAPQAEVAAARVHEVLWGSWVRMLDEEVLVLPDASPVEVPGARQAFDVIGITYRHALSVGADGALDAYPRNVAVDGQGEAPWAEGLALVLQRVAEELPERDLMVGEVGLPDLGGDDRVAYLREVGSVLRDAAADAMPLVGAFHDIY